MSKLVPQSDHVTSPIGGIWILSDRNGLLRALEFDDLTERMHRLLRDRCGIDGFTLVENRTPSRYSSALQAYFRGDLAALDCVVASAGGTSFQKIVWTALWRIRAGETISYGALAARIGRPAASRAVGHANATNPIPLIVPCHRVLGADGSLTGYGGGLERKRWLSNHERNHSRID